jgi:hypothetical protein
MFSTTATSTSLHQDTIGNILLPNDAKSSLDNGTLMTDASPQLSKYKNMIPSMSATSNSNSDQGTDMQYNAIDQLLETEKQRNKTDAWNKLDKTQKTLNLHAFAEKYGKEHALPVKEIKNLKLFFSDCLNKAKLQKTKDVIYNKETREITSIPALFFNSTSHSFTLKMMDAKRVSTLKSLTPKRIVKDTAEETV